MIRQIYGQLRDRILTGALSAGTRLPSSRDLAGRLGVSRNVVLEAYDLLYAEGFTQSMKGSGTFIAEGACFEPAIPAPSPERIQYKPVSMGDQADAGTINFKSGTPDLSFFPTRTWLSMLKQVHQRSTSDTLGYGQPEGRQELREAICRHVVERRGVSCHPDQIVITAGTTQAIGIVCAMLAGKRIRVIIEDPITKDIQKIFRTHGTSLHPVPVDNHGMVTSCLPDDVPLPLLFITPSHQFPLGGTLPIQRRIELLDYAARTDALILEDDYDSEFRFDGPPISSLHGLAPERVIYIGTFSKTFCPAIRTGYMVVPEAMIHAARTYKWRSDLHGDSITQLALAQFIDGGHYQRHLSKMKKLYRKRRDKTVATLLESFQDDIEILGSATGLHLAVRFRGICFDDELLKQVERAGARFYPASHHCVEGKNHTDTLIIGYGNLDEHDIARGIGLLKQELNRLL